MAIKKTIKKKKPIESYVHKDKKRVNNPPVGLVTPDTDPETEAKKTYAYDPHLDPQLQWAGKTEHTSFVVPSVSLHVHERIDPRTIIEAVRRAPDPTEPVQLALFQTKEENPPLRDAIEFYQHPHGWSNRLVAGDSLLVMNSLLEKEGLAGKVQMVYIDPPYGIKYKSNFQPFTNKRDVKDGKDEDLTAEPEQIRAFRDTWELDIHSYLTYLRDRLLLTRELLTESGSVFVQINDENLHHIRELMDEVFGAKKFIAVIAFKTATNQNAKRIQRLYDYLVWYGRSNKLKFNALYRQRTNVEVESTFNNIEKSTGRRFKAVQLDANYTPAQLNFLRKAGRLVDSGKYGKRFPEDFAYTELDNVWWGTIISTYSKEKVYVVQTSTEAIKRAILMTTDPGDLVFDPTCGSGTTAFVAEQWGRRWITCDTSRVAITLAKQRLMTHVFNYYELAHPDEGVGSGFNYETAPHITFKSILNHEPPAQETLYDRPFVDRKKHRVSGPFTVEAVPAPVVKSVEELLEGTPQNGDISIARSGETLRQGEWRDELMRTGIRGKAGQYIRFARLEPLPGCRHLHAEGVTKEDVAKRIVISFGPEYALLEQRQVAQAIEEAQTLVPKPKLIVFAAFHFDPEAAKDIDETNWPGVTMLKAMMNDDLLTEDLKKKRVSNESFWLIGQPDVRLKQIAKGVDKGKWQVSVEGFDYFNIKNGNIESGDAGHIAVWLLDTDYDGRSLYPRQVFFPLAGNNEGWAQLAKNLKAEIDDDLIEAYRGIESLPFTVGKHKRIAVKIVDDRGIESLKLLGVE